jgi:ABC-type polysaccharide/polyol phosphate export permease
VGRFVLVSKSEMVLTTDDSKSLKSPSILHSSQVTSAAATASLWLSVVSRLMICSGRNSSPVHTFFLLYSFLFIICASGGALIKL